MVCLRQRRREGAWADGKGTKREGGLVVGSHRQEGEDKGGGTGQLDRRRRLGRVRKDSQTHKEASGGGHVLGMGLEVLGATGASRGLTRGAPGRAGRYSGSNHCLNGCWGCRCPGSRPLGDPRGSGSVCPTVQLPGLHHQLVHHFLRTFMAFLLSVIWASWQSVHSASGHLCSFRRGSWFIICLSVCLWLCV